MDPGLSFVFVMVASWAALLRVIVKLGWLSFVTSTMAFVSNCA